MPVIPIQEQLLPSRPPTLIALRSFVALAAFAVLAACGGGGSTASSPTPTSGGATATSGGGGEDVDAYCAASLQIETAAEPDIDFDSATPEELAEVVRTFATEEILPLAEVAQEAAAEEIAADVETLVGITREAAETGDPALFESEEFLAAQGRVHEYDLETCGWAAADVTGVDYEFQGLEATYTAGPTSFDFTNGGTELHEFVVFRKNEGVTQSFDEILGLGEEESAGLITQVAQTFAFPGTGGYTVAELEAGDYIALCFIPTGLTPEVAAAAETATEPPEFGPPHFTQGMRAEFSVS